MKKKFSFLMASILACALCTNAWAVNVGDTITYNKGKYKVVATNLISNPGFTEGFTGWTNANDFTTEITDANFTIASEEGHTDYLVGTVNGGSTAVSSLGTAWEIEANKSYYFTYEIKSISTSTNATYMKVSLTNTKGTETSVLGTPGTITAGAWSIYQTVFKNSNSYAYCQVMFRWLNNQWGFDNFGLYEVEEILDLTALNDEIETAKTERDKYEAGTEGYNIIDKAITTAETFKTEITSSTTPEQVTEVVNMLKNSYKEARATLYLSLTDGDYLFYNIGSGKWLGGANDWGTQASLVPHGQYFTTAKQTDGTYKLDSHTYNNATDHFFNGSYVDNGTPIAIEFIKTATEGVVNLKYNNAYFGYNGTNTVLASNLTDASSANAQWRIYSADEIKAMEGSVAAPVDMTGLIKGANFSRNHYNPNFESVWTKSADNFTQYGGNNDNMCAESWRSTFDISQTLADMPNGAYTFRIQGGVTDYAGLFDGANYPVAYANASTQAISNMEGSDRSSSMSAMSTAFSAGKYYTKLIPVVVTDGSLQVGVRGTRTDTWVCWDNFELAYRGAYVATTDLTITGKSSMEQATKQTLSVAVAPTTASFPELTYTSKNPAIATIDATTGEITALSVGKDTIVVSVYGFSKEFEVTVTAPAVEPTEVKLDTTSLNVTFAEVGTTYTITASILPAEAQQGILWSSSNEAVASVSDGVVTFKDLGNAVITAKAMSKPTVFATVDVTITPAPAPAYYSEIGKGQFILCNAATGQYLGGGNDWGTKATRIQHPILATITEGTGTYKISDIAASTNGLGKDCYIDQSPTIELTATKQSNGAYTLAYGGNLLASNTENTVLNYLATEASNPHAQWYLISKKDAQRTWLNASNENPIDVTYLVKDPNFDRNSGYYNKWTFTASNKNNSGDVKNYCVESYYAVFTMSQTIKVPNGTYRVKAQGFYRQDGSDNENLPYFFANDEKQTFPKLTTSENTMIAASASFLAGKYYCDPIIVTVTDNTLTIGAKNDVNVNLWCIWDNFSVELLTAPATANMTVAAANKWATFYAPFDVDVPANVYSYAIDVDGSNNAVRVKIGGDAAYTLPAETPVLVYCDSTIGYKETYIDGTAEGTPVVVNAANALVGTSVALDPVPASTSTVTNYVLQNGTKGIGWYAVNNNTLAANRAYLSVDAGVGVKGILDDATGINNVDVDADVDVNAIYNLAGQRINKMQKGINIVNGKKVMF